MASAFPLQPVLDVAAQRLEAATPGLQRLALRRQEAQSKLDQLLGFQQEYQSGLKAALEQGLTADRLRDYQAFLAKVERAVRMQSEEVQRCQQDWETAHRHWLDLRAREQAMLVLKQRHDAGVANRVRRQEQKQQDEFALRGGQGKPTDGA